MAAVPWEQKAVLKTLLYAAKFGFPLRLNQIHRRLIADKKVSLSKVSAQIRFLRRRRAVKESGGYFFPACLKTGERKQPGMVFDKKLLLAKRASFLAKSIPWVVFVGLTGSLAAGSPQKEDDIDLMVITKPKRLWLARGLVYFQFMTLGRFLGLRLRRPRESRARNKICFNLFLTANRLVMPPSRRRLFTAYQLMFLKPLANKGGIYQQLIQANRFWLKNYLANWLSTFSKNKTDGSACSRGWRAVDHLDLIAFKLQKKYMSGRITKEKISRETAFFHLKKRE